MHEPRHVSPNPPGLLVTRLAYRRAGALEGNRDGRFALYCGRGFDAFRLRDGRLYGSAPRWGRPLATETGWLCTHYNRLPTPPCHDATVIERKTRYTCCSPNYLLIHSMSNTHCNHKLWPALPDTSQPCQTYTVIITAKVYSTTSLQALKHVICDNRKIKTDYILNKQQQLIVRKSGSAVPIR
jgi:hypothetical protein